MGNGTFIALSLLNHSAVFGTYDYDILLQSLYGILGFLAQLFCGLVRICQTDTKELIYLVHALTAYTLRHLVESLLTITYIISYMPMTHHFIYHFNQRIHIHLWLL